MMNSQIKATQVSKGNQAVAHLMLAPFCLHLITFAASYSLVPHYSPNTKLDYEHRNSLKNTQIYRI